MLSITVHKSQANNPLLKHARFFKKLQTNEEMKEDYLINSSTSVLFLDLTYHIKFPDYIKARIDDLAKEKPNVNRILLLHQDTKQPLNEVFTLLQVECMKANTTMLVCWSYEEAAQYLHTMKSY